MSSRTRPSSGRNTATKSSPIADSLIQVVSITVSSGGTDRPPMKTMVFLSEPPRGSIRAIEGIQEGRELRLHRLARMLHPSGVDPQVAGGVTEAMRPAKPDQRRDRKSTCLKYSN